MPSNGILKKSVKLYFTQNTKEIENKAETI